MYIKSYIKYIIAVLSILFISVGGYVCYRFSSVENDDNNDVIAFVETTELSSEKIVNNFYIDIKGCVNKPGVYYVSEGMIVSDAITLAGGLKNTAYTDNINLALRLYNEMVIYVNCKSDLISKVTTTIKNDALVSTTTTKGIVKEILVNINTASLEELLTVSGIGESKAKAIISYREKKKFEVIEDIKNVSGIGDSLFEQIKNSITV